MSKQRIGIALFERVTALYEGIFETAKTRSIRAFRRIVGLTDRESVRRYGAFVLLAILVASTGLASAATAARPMTGLGAQTPGAILVAPSVAAGTTVGAPADAGTAQTAAANAAASDATSATPVVGPIGPNAQLKLSSRDVELLAHIISAESRDEPYAGQVAVGAVILNRVRMGGEFGTGVAGVVYRPGQFEPVSNGTINLTPTTSAYKAARAAAQGQDPTNGAIYFWNPAKAYSGFLWSRPLKIEIGRHRFTG